MKQSRTFFLVFAFGLSAWGQAAPQPTSSKSNGTADYSHANQLLQQGKYDDAIAELQQVSAAHPGTAGIEHELGTAYYQKGDYPHAIESLKQALQRNAEYQESTQLL